MFGRLADSPITIILILVVILLLFGAPKLPGMARSLGQSMRIFKSEVKEMKHDDDPNVTVNGQPVAKLSDTPGKSMCDDEKYLAYLRQVFEIAAPAAQT